MRGNRPVSSHGSDQLISSPDNDVVRRLRRLARRREPGLVLLEGPRVLAGSADPYGPKAVRASAGNVFRLVVARAIWKDLEGLDGFGAAPSGGAPLAEASIESAGMIVLGSEAHGVSRKDLMLVTVPLTEGVESLNVAAAAALILFEIKRRRVA